LRLWLLLLLLLCLRYRRAFQPRQQLCGSSLQPLLWLLLQRQLLLLLVLDLLLQVLLLLQQLLVLVLPLLLLQVPLLLLAAVRDSTLHQ
jgi:hypothetical protein